MLLLLGVTALSLLMRAPPQLAHAAWTPAARQRPPASNRCAFTSSRWLSMCLHSEQPPQPEVRCDGTRPGYDIIKTLSVPEDGAVPPDTPLPEALTLLDAAAFPSMSRARKSCRRGAVIVNGREGRCLTAVGPGDAIALQERRSPGFTPRGKPPFPVPILFEDEHLAVVLKPAGVVTHPPPGGAAGSRSMRTAVMHALAPPPEGTPGALYRPHLVHRLDKPTSGLMLCAKTKPALLALSKDFAQRRIKKQYRAVVCGRVRGDAGEVDADVDGRRAVTGWRVTGRHRSLKLGGGHLTSLALFPRTGRTHQLRRHCAEVFGTPIVGDAAYGGEDAGCGLMLAAVALEFRHPAAPEGAPELRVEGEEPSKFDSLRRREHSRWLQLGARADDGAERGGAAAKAEAVVGPEAHWSNRADC